MSQDAGPQPHTSSAPAGLEGNTEVVAKCTAPTHSLKEDPASRLRSRSWKSWSKLRKSSPPPAFEAEVTQEVAAPLREKEAPTLLLRMKSTKETPALLLRMAEPEIPADTPALLLRMQNPTPSVAGSTTPSSPGSLTTISSKLHSCLSSPRPVACSPSSPSIPNTSSGRFSTRLTISPSPTPSGLPSLKGTQSTESIGDGVQLLFGSSTPTKTVTNQAEWITAWTKAAEATVFVFPHRRRELDAYKQYIMDLFISSGDHIHERIVLLDRKIRNEVAGRRDLLLSDCRNSSRSRKRKTRPVEEPGATTEGVMGRERKNLSVQPYLLSLQAEPSRYQVRPASRCSRVNQSPLSPELSGRDTSGNLCGPGLATTTTALPLCQQNLIRLCHARPCLSTRRP